jgi:hypothetical protein
MKWPPLLIIKQNTSLFSELNLTRYIAIFYFQPTIVFSGARGTHSLRERHHPIVNLLPVTVHFDQAVKWEFHADESYSLFFGCTRAFALRGPSAQTQTIMGSIRGEVTDSSGALMPTTQVTAVNLDTGVKRRTSTNATGVCALRFMSV